MADFMDHSVCKSEKILTAGPFKEIRVGFSSHWRVIPEDQKGNAINEKNGKTQIILKEEIKYYPINTWRKREYRDKSWSTGF